MNAKTNPRWPVLTRYDQDHLEQIALPLGGIGTGTVSLGGRGDLRSWEIVNRPAKGFTPDHCFFAVYAKPAGRPAVTRAMEGQIPPHLYEGQMGSPVRNHGLPRFAHCRFAAAYPFGQVLLSDPDVPVDVRIEAFNPLIPADADASGIPVAVLRFVLRNKTFRPVAASVCGSVRNFIGADGSGGEAGFAGVRSHAAMMKQNVNTFRNSGGLRGVFLHTRRDDTWDERYGSIALTTTARSKVTARTAWAAGRWGGGLLDFWDDFSDDGLLEERSPLDVPDPMASLAVAVAVPARQERAVTFLLTWHFPNRYTWTRQAKPGDACCGGGSDPDRIGNYYATRYASAWDVAVRTARVLPRLEADTLAFVGAVCESDLPAAVKEAALYNLTALRSQTAFRTPDGRLFGFEGCCDASGCCHGSCTHVWNYEQATAFLFGGLSRTMREVEFAHATRDDGHMSFRVNLPLSRATEFGIAAADGQLGCLMKLYRDWQLSGDDAMLQALWPKARKALEFCWVPGGWDADRDGVMEGCQHNTMDVEYYGPNAEIGGWYLGALRAAEEMARYLGEGDFADTCRGLFERGRSWIDENLFNGEYYEHRIQPPASGDDVAKGLRADMGAQDPTRPDFQLGTACLVDQLVGQCMAHVCGLGHLLDPEHVQRTLRSIYRYNFRRGLGGHFNNMRTFALNDESGLLIATYPRGSRPRSPFPYFGEVWTGLEYTAAAGMIQEGLIEQGLECISAARRRYDGRRRSPFDEAECGHHYARAMASWAAWIALTGFRYSGVERSIEFAAPQARDSNVFWSNGYAWGTCRRRRVRGGLEVTLRALHGRVRLKSLTITGLGTAPAHTLGKGESLRVIVRTA